jgi:hypothetical protein
MKTFYWWNHWFWITLVWFVTMSHQEQLSTLATPIPFSSFETISTSLKSALVQNDNSFQQNSDQQKIGVGSKNVPMSFETSDVDDLHGGGFSDIEREKAVEWFVKPNPKDESNIEVGENLEKNKHIPNDQSAAKTFTLSNVNTSTNALTETYTPTAATTLLTSVATSTESNVMLRSESLKIYVPIYIYCTYFFHSFSYL